MASASDTLSNGLYDTLTAPTYSLAEVSRLTGIARWSISRWLRGYKYEGGAQGPIISRSIPAESTYASFLDLIDLLFVKELLDRDFSLQRIRKALDDARKYLGAPHFATKKFYTCQDRIFLELPQNEIVALLAYGQRAMNIIIEQIYDKLDFEDITEFGFARRWYPRGRNEGIVIDPQISFGRPTVLGYGVAVSNIYDLYLGENEESTLVSNWFNIPLPQIEAAVRFEHSLCA